MIPIIIITGFLGSGKTTLLNKILADRKNYKIGVVLNEFGNVSLESKFVKTEDEKVVEISAGCVCCVARGDILKALNSIVQFQPETELVIMEASGLSDALSLSLTMYSPSIADKFLLDSIVCVIDCINFEKTLDENDIIRDQIIASNVVYLAKTESVDAAQIGRILELASDLNPKALVIRDTDTFNFDLILGTNLDPSKPESHEHSEHDHEDFETFTFETNEPIDYNKFENYIRTIPANIYRVKGFIHFKNAPIKDKQYMLQYVMGRRDYVLNDDESHSTHLLFVGKKLDKEAIKNSLSGILFNNNVVYNTISKIFNIFHS